MKRLLVAALAAATLLLGAFTQAGATHRSQGPVRSPAHLSTHRIWSASIQPNADSAPAFLPRVRVTGGHIRPVVYVVAANNGSNCDPGNPVTRATTYAFDAATGKLYWSRATSGASRCTTAGPVADPSGKWVYAPGLDGKMHRYDAGTGRESTAQGWPKAITILPDVEKMASTATIGGHFLYVTTSGFIGDQGHYEGHLVTINLQNGRTHVFNSLCSNIHHLLGPSSCSAVQSGLFGRGEGAIDPVTHAVYVVSGNGPWDGHTNWGDSVLKLDPSGAHLLDSFTPTNQTDLAAGDLDLGSTGPAMLPTVHQGGRAYHLLVQGGKGPACSSCGGVPLRLLNRDNLSGKGGPGHLGGDVQDIQTPGGCEVLTAPAVHGTWVYYANDCGTAAYQLVAQSGGFRLVQRWHIKTPGTTPVIAYGALWVVHAGAIEAYRLSDGKVLWSTGIGDIHWEYPLVTHHRLFITDNNGHLYAYAASG